MNTYKPLFFFVLLFTSSLLFSQSITPPNPRPPGPGLPIDGFLGLLMIIAVGYGVYVFARRHDEAISSNKKPISADKQSKNKS
ncbi:MAG TPA: hypothetical protein EYG92_11340 [Lutibacter sp.]|nr:hypothetical protein [Lutibacter sp.]